MTPAGVFGRLIVCVLGFAFVGVASVVFCRLWLVSSVGCLCLPTPVCECRVVAPLGR